MSQGALGAGTSRSVGEESRQVRGAKGAAEPCSRIDINTPSQGQLSWWCWMPPGDPRRRFLVAWDMRSDGREGGAAARQAGPRRGTPQRRTGVALGSRFAHTLGAEIVRLSDNLERSTRQKQPSPERAAWARMGRIYAAPMGMIGAMPIRRVATYLLWYHSLEAGDHDGAPLPHDNLSMRGSAPSSGSRQQASGQPCSAAALGPIPTTSLFLLLV